MYNKCRQIAEFRAIYGFEKAAIAGLNKFLRIYYARVSEVYTEIVHDLVFSSDI
jgi:hypothetical protein